MARPCASLVLPLVLLALAPPVAAGQFGKGSMYQRLFDAVAKNRPKELEALLKERPDVNRPYSDGETLLMRAATDGRDAMVALLLRSGAKVDQIDSDGDTALVYAASADRYRIMDMLLRAGANPNGVPGGPTPLAEAAAGGHFDVMERLFSVGAEIDRAGDWQGTTPLIRAAQFGQERTVRYLLARGANPTLRNRFGATALSEAIRLGHRKVEAALDRAIYPLARPLP